MYDDAVKNKMFWNATPSFQEFQRRLQNPKYVQTVQANYRAHGRSGDAFDTLSGFRDYFCVSDEDRQEMTQGVGNMIADTKARLAGQQRYRKLKQHQDKQRGRYGRLDLGVKNPLTNDNVVREPLTGKYQTSDGAEYALEFDAARAQNNLDEIDDNYTEAVKRGDLPSAFEVRDEDGNYALVEELGVKPGVHVTEKGKQQQLAGLVNTRKSVEEQYNALYRKLEEDFKRSAPFSLNTHSQYGIDDNDMRLQAYLNSNAQYRRLKAQLHQLDNAIGVGKEAVKGRAEDRYVKNAKGMLGYAYRDLKTFGASALRGLWNAVSDVSTWDLGLQDLQDNMTLYTTVKKARQKGYKNLNSEERQMLDVAAKTGAYTAENQQYLGRGYKAGNVTGESLPFMVEMALNPASGLGEAVMSKYMRNAIAKYGKEAVRKEAWKYVTKKCGYRIAGDVLGAALMTGTTGSARTLADTYDRLTGDIKSTHDSDGKIVYDGTENEEKGILKAYLKAFGATAIENHSEFVGEYFNPLLKGAGTLTMKGWKKVNAKSANAFLDNLKDMGNTSTAKWLGNLFDKTQWHGTIGEYAEEVVGNIENALLVGDSTLDAKEGTGVFNLDQNIDTFLGVSLMGGFFSTLKTGAYIRDKVKGERKILMQQSLDLDNSIRYALGADPRLADKWKEWRVALAQGTDEEKKQALKEISENTNGYIKKAMYDYSANAQKIAGMDKATQGAIEDGTITPEQAQRDADIEQAHEEGLAAEGTARHDIQQEHQLRENSLARMLGISAEQLDRMEDEDIESMTGQNDALDTAIYDYQTSRERYQGVIDRATDEVEQAGIDAAHQIDLYTDHSTGQIRPCVIKGNNGKEDYQGYIVNGNIATHPDGAIDVSGSDKMILYFDPETGKIEHGDASTFASLGESADATVARQQAIDEAKQQAAQAQSRDIDGGVGEDGNVSEAMPTSPQSSYQEERNAADFDIGQVVNAETGEVIPVSFEGLAEGENAYLTGGRPDGKTKDRLKVTIVDAEGNVTNRVMKRGNVQVDGRMSAEDFRNAYEEAVSSRIAPEADMNGQENNVDEEGVVAGDAAPSADRAATSEEEGVASEPAVRDKNGNPIYDKMPISATIADLYDGALDDAEIDGFVSAQIAEAEKAVEKMEKKKPKVGTDKAKYLADKKAWEEGLQEAQRKVQYWQDVKSEVEKITTPEDARGYEEELNGDAAQTAYRNGSDAAAYGAREVTAEFMQSGDVKITPESYRKETGFGAAEQRAMVGKISKGGKSIDRLAEDLEVFDRENYNGMYFGGDSSVAKDAILDYLSSPDSRKGVKKMQSEAEREYVEAYEAERDRYYQEKYHMSYEEYLVYSSQEMPELLRKYSNFDEQLFLERYADEIEAALQKREEQLKQEENGKEGNVSAGEESGHGRSNQVQSGERTDDTGRGEVGKDSAGEVGPRHEGVVESEAALGSGDTNVNSGGIFRNKYTDKNDIVWPEPTVGSNANTDTAEVADSPTGEVTKGETVDRGGNSSQPISSGSKDTNNTDTKQGNEEKSVGGEKEPMSPTPAMIDRMIEEQRVDDVSELLISSELKKAAEGIAEAFGMKVVYLKKVFIKSDDPAVEDFEGNGFVRNGVIYLSLKEADIAQFTFGHELLHQLKQIDADSYMRIRQKVIAVMGRKAFEMEVKARQMTYANVPGYTLFEDYAEEVIADTLGDIITHTDMLPNIARSLKENPSLLDRFLNVVDNVRQYFRGKIGGALGDLVNDIRNTYEMTARQGAELGLSEPRGEREQRAANERFKGEGYQYMARNKFSLRLAEAKNNTDKNPSQAQKESGNYRKGHIRFGGYNYTIENPQGSYRSGVDENGKKWKQKMNNTYGYILGTKGKDGDHLDMFINDNADLDSWNGNVYVVDQVFPDGSFDEHKVMYGFDSEEEARKAYLSNYEQGWQGLGNITGVSKEDFDRWLEKSGRKTKAFSEYKNVKSESAESPKTGAFGTVYTQFRGKAQEAFDFLASHGSGDLLGVFHREGVGDTDAVWGDKGGGLDHIIRKHIGDGKSFHNIVEAANVIDDIIKTGSKAFENGDKIVFKNGSKLVTIRKNVRNKGKKIADKNWVLTAYDELSADGDVSAIAPVNQGQAARTTGKSQHKDTTKPSYSQKKNVKSNKKIPFSLKKDRTLVGVHNITEEKLLKAIKQGGLANPSVAVIDSSKQNHDDYGDISLILPSDKVAKRTGKNAGTWQGDAWTPTYPQVERQMSNKGAEKASNDVSSVPGDMYSEVRRGLDRWLDGGEENSAMAYMFLHEKGVAPEPKKIQPKFSDEAYNELKSITAGNFNIYGIGKADAQKVLDMYIDAKFDGDKDLYEEKTKAWLERNKSIVDAGANGGMRYAIAKENVELYDEYGFNYKGVQTFVRDVEYDHRKTGVDMNATLNEVEDYIKTNNLTDEFNTWMEGKEKEYGIKEVIFDGFTPSGNRRYVPNTLENVSKIMKKQGRNGSTGISVSFQNFAARLMPSYGTLKDIRSKKGLLTSDRENLDKFREKWSNVFFELGVKCQPDATGTFDDYGLARLSEAAMTSDPQAYLKKEYNVDFSDEDTKRLKEMVKAIKEESPAMYFETKFERPVGFGEFSSAVVPTTASNEVKQALQNAGVQIYEYDKEKEGDRSRAFNEALEGDDNIRFSLDKDKGTVVSPSKPSKAEAVLRDAVIDRLRENGMEVITDVAEGQKVLDEANGEEVMLSAKQKRALETATMADESTNKATVVSSADGAKVQNNLEILADSYKNRPNKAKGFITDLSRSLGLEQHEASQYGTFVTENGKTVTIRVSNHNARVSFFDKKGENDGISIVISNHKNKGLLNDGNAHIIEFFYSKQSLQRADSKPLSDIIRSVSEALYSGEFMDTTGLAERQEVNAKQIREQRMGGADGLRFFRTANGEAYGFTVGGRNYVDPRIATSETPVHEYAHLWATALRSGNKEEWQNVVGLMKDSKVWDEVKKRYPELKTDDEIADEVIATYSGRRGAERLREERRKIAGGDGGVFEKAEAISALEKVKRALKMFWKGVADFLHIHYKSAEEVADRVMKDLLDGVDPRKMGDGVDRQRYASLGVSRSLGEEAGEGEPRWASLGLSEQQLDGDDTIRFSLRQEPAPKVTKKGYAVFIYKKLKNGGYKLVPKMLSNDPGAPAQTWLNADTGYMKRDENGEPLQNTNGRASVSVNGSQAGGNKSNKLAWRPGKHLAMYPNASQFKSPDGTIPKDVIFFEVEYAADPDLHKQYQRNAWELGMNDNGQYRNNQGGLPYIPKDSYYLYRTNSISEGATPMIITGAYKINRALTDAEAKELNQNAGGMWCPRKGGDLTEEKLKDMGLDDKGLKKMTESFDMDTIKESHDESDEARLLPGYRSREINWEDKDLIHSIEENGQNINDYRDGYVAPEHSEEPTIRFSLDKDKGTVASPSKPSKAEAVLRDAVIDRLRENGMEVITDVAEGQKVLDEANGKGKLQMGDAPETFAERQKLAVENRGVVMPGLNETYVEVVKDIPRHGYTGTIAEATRQAIQKAKEKYVPEGKVKVLHYDNNGAEFDYVISGNAIEICLSPKHQAKSGNKGVHLALAEHLDEVINKSVEVEEHPDYIKGKDGKRGEYINPNAIMHRFYGVAIIDGVPCRIMTLMREDARSEESNGIHSYEVQKIEMLDNELPSISNGVGTQINELSAYPLAKLLKGVEKAYDKGKYLLEESKKRSAGLREQRVYHGSGADGMRFFRTANGEAYGFTVGGKIYVDPRIATSETPVHEYAHLWASALRSGNAEEWQNVVGLMKDSKVWDEVKKRYPELKTDDEIADEVIATYSGRRGAERLREEQRKIAEGDGGVFEKAEAISALEKVKLSLKRFWKGVADFLHIHYKSAEEVADRVMKDLLEGVDPRKMGETKDGGVRFNAKQKRALETASLGNAPRSLTVVSSATGAKILNSIDKLVESLEKSATQPKTFIGNVAKALGASRFGSGSEYATFETKNGDIVTIRLANHNAHVSGFDHNGKDNGISIVISPKPNEGITNDGNAHITEFYYDSIKLRRADGKPLAEIVRSIKQALYSGEFKDTTGLAERQEVNGEDVIRYQFIGEKGAAEADHAEEVSVRLDNLSVARDMEAEKKDAKAIKMATGWERGADGKWRYEIADLKEFDRNGNLLYRKHHPDYARYIELQDKDLKNLLEDGEELTDKEREEYEALTKKYESDKFGGEKLDNIHTLEAYVDAPELFKAYPELKGVGLRFEDTGGNEAAAYYPISSVIDFDGDDVGEIVVNTGKVSAYIPTKELKSIILHEIQHAIQVIEGFAEGGSPQYMKGLYSDYFLQDYSSSQLHELAELRRIAEGKVKRGEYKRMSYAVKNVIKAAKEHGFYPTWAESFDNNPNSVTTVYDTLVKFPSEILDKAVLIDERDLYNRVAGEVEARNVQERMGMSAEERRASLAAETEDVAREDQIFLMGNGVSEMGSRVGKRMAEIGEHYEDRALTDEERPIVDVFCGRNDNLKVSIERDGKSLVLMMRQGSENGAGTKHCLYRHYGTGVGYLTADDILKIPFVMANGTIREKLRGKSRLVEYTYKDKHGCVYTLLTEKKKGFEIFNDFYTNRKASSLSTFNTSEDAHTGSDNALTAAKLGNVSETAKESEEKDRQRYASLGVSRSLGKEAAEGEPRYASLGLSEQQLDGDDTIRFSLNYDKWDREMASWLKRNRLPKNAQRPVVPQREAGESDLHFAGRLAKYNQDKALWNTAPKYEGHLSSGMTARGEFNYELQRGSVLTRIAVQDSMLAIRKAQEAIARHSGLLKVGTFEDAYMAENNSHGKAKNEFEQYDQEYLAPLRKWFNVMMKRLDGSYNNVTNYMIAKHGLERNAHMAFMAALEAEAKKAIDNTQPDAKRLRAQMVHDAYKQYKADSRRLINDADYEAGKYDYAQWRRTDDAIRKSYCSNYESFRYNKGGVVRDYAGLSSLFLNETDFEEKAAELCADIESKNGHETGELWDAVRQATRQILKNSHDAGMMSDETYDYVRGMYEHYIPLRGWNDSAADEVWDYAGGGRGVFNAALKEAHGRQSLADDPVAYIMNMAESGFLVNNKNWVKQHFLMMAMNHPSDLLTVSKAWYVKTKDQFGNEVWIPASPNIPADETDPAVIQAALDAFQTKMEQMEQSGDATQQRGSLNIEYPQTKMEEREHEVRVMKDGEEYVIYVNGDPQLAQALNNTRAMRVRQQEGNFEKACAWLGRKMAAVYTSLSPLFVPSNWARDTTMTLASTAIREDARYNWLLRTKFMRPDVQMRMFGLVKEYQNGKLREKVKSRTATKTEENFWNFMINGGETGFVSTMDVDAFREKIQRDLKDMGRTRLNPVKIGHIIADSVEYINRVIEDSNRFAIYQTSIEYGRGIEEAVQDAKNVTLNFNRKGTGEMGMSAIRQLYLFINPAIQSLQTLGALAKDHKAKFTAVTSAWMASGVLVPLFNELMFNLASAVAGGGGDDDDEFNPKDEYWKFSSFDRRNNCILWIPFTHNFIKIPLTQEFRGFYGIGDMVASAMWGGENAKESWSNYAADLMGQIIDLSPLDPVSYDGNVLVSLMPNAIRPLVEIAQNVTFTGKPIYRESDFNKYDPSFKKAYAGTPDFLLRYSKWMNSIGNKYPEAQQGPVEQTAVGRYANNPAVIDHLLKSYLGGMYTLGSQIAGAITKASDEETRKDFKTADIPFFSKFVANPNDRPQSKNKGDAYWQDYEKYQRASHTLGVIRQDARKTGNFSVLEDFYRSEEYKEMKEYEPKAKQRKEEQKYEKWKEEGNADLYQPHQQTGEDVYKRHSTPADDFEDTKASILYQKIKPAKDIFDLADINTPSGMDTFNKYYDLAGKVEEAHSVKKEMNAIVKSFVNDEHKAAFDPEKMKEYRALRKQYLQLVEDGNRMFEKIKAQRN